MLNFFVEKLKQFSLGFALNFPFFRFFTMQISNNSTQIPTLENAASSAFNKVQNRNLIDFISALSAETYKLMQFSPMHSRCGISLFSDIFSINSSSLSLRHESFGGG